MDNMSQEPWNQLSIKEKSEMMRAAINNGITDLADIRKKYNEFAKGGYKSSDNIRRRITQYEGAAMTGAIDPLSGKWGSNRSFEAEDQSFYNALPESIREQVLSNPSLADNLYSYSYNVGAGNFKKRVIPTLEKYYQGAASIQDVEDSMWASGDKKLRGLRRRRAEERAGVRNALSGDFMPAPHTEVPVSTFIYNPYEIQQRQTTVLPYDVPDEDSYVTTHTLSPSEQRQQKIRETIEATQRFNNLMNLFNIQNNPLPVFTPKSPLDIISTLNSKAEGGSIHIKPSHRGRLTELKARTGKSEAELYNDGNPAHKRMVVFARNARKWKHGLGGNLFSGEEDGSQQMKFLV